MSIVITRLILAAMVIATFIVAIRNLEPVRLKQMSGLQFFFSKVIEFS